MATTGSLLSQEKFLCPVCLDVFTKPVSTPCGHNFCSACIHKYWDNSDVCQCPFCKKVFPARPELQVNTVISELVAECKTLGQVKVSTPGLQLPSAALVLCDICCEKEKKAVKSCLMCLASFCEMHLEPHGRVAGLKSHTLLDPVRNLEDKICKTHNKITELFCRTDQACVCALCLKDDHKGHHVVSLEEKYEEVMSVKDETIENIQQMIRLRSGKITEIKNAVDEAEKEKNASVQVLADLMRFIQRSQAELIDVLEERYRGTKQKAEGFLTELKKEVAELESRSAQLEQLSQSDDHHHFLQSFPTLSSPSHKDWTGIGVCSNISVEALRSAATRLKQRVDEVMEELPLIKLKRMREHAVDLTLDPDTAYFSLRVSQDGKQVAKVDTELELPHNPERFETCPEIVAKEGFTAGKFYYEVQVRGDTSWAVGVARESVDRKASTALSVEHGFWTIWHSAGIFKTSTKPSVDITLKEAVEKVGIFVDYDKGAVSFYDVDSETHIYSFTGYQFTDKLYPYFSFADSTDETNSAPFIIITPVPKTH